MRGLEKIKKLNERDFETKEVINILLYLVLCVMPLILGGSGSDRYYFPKAVFLDFIGFIIFLLLIKEKEKLNRKVDKVYLLFFLLLFLSAIFAEDLERAIFGGKWRYEGIITLFMYGVLFIAASRYFIFSKKGLEVFLGSGLIVSIYYILQNNGVELMKFWLGTAEKMNTTIGNRNFVGTYVLIFLALSISLFIFYNNKRYLIYSLIYFAALIYSQTRGAWVGLLFLCFVGLLFIIKDKKKIMRAGIIVVSFIGIFMIINTKSEGVILARVETIKEEVKEFKEKDIKAGSGRLGIYIGTFHMIKDRPFLGAGVENFWYGFEKSAPKEIIEAWNAQNTIVDKAHNEILHYAGISGILSAITYIMLIFIVMKNLWKKRNNENIKIIFIVLVGYLFQANFNISVVSVAPIFWIILGFGSSRTIEKNIKWEILRKKECE
ncbi:MAG: O-antigen ligase family protein [Clostridium sp.]|uniref:O-antigen ligase family protein n=1 Tax=Clostridium sp. TaxID=1506 RepID=UPI003EE59F33